MTKPIGILGGTFDPVHNGHIRMAIECYERLDLEEVRIIPLHTPPHRHQPAASPAQRFKMLDMATEKLDEITVDVCELEKGGVSYTIDTVRLMRERFRGSSLCLLMGMDAFNVMHTWRHWKELLDYVHIVIAERPGSLISPDNPDLKDLMDCHQTDSLSQLHDSPCGRIFKIAVPLLDISSTQIRDIFLTGRNPSMLLPENVIEYVKAGHIYS
jgi:nicotinate-nucleotide adenylyltransferase